MNIFPQEQSKQNNNSKPNSTPKREQSLPYLQTEINLMISLQQKQQNFRQTLENQDSPLILLLKSNIAFIGRMMQEVMNNEELLQYFQIAGVQRLQVLESLNQIKGIVQTFVGSLLRKDINRFILKSTFQYFDQYFGSTQFSTLSNCQKALKILDFQSNMSSCIQLLAGSLFLPPDITTQSKQKHQNVWNKVKFQKCGKVEEVAQELKSLKRMLGVTTSAVLDQNQKSGAFTKIMAFCLSFPQYYLSHKVGKLKSMRFYRRPTIDIAQKIWNLPQSGLTAELTKLVSMKSISTNLKIYVPLQQDIIPQDILEYNIQAIQVRVLYYDSLINKKNKKSNNLFCCGNQQNQKISKIILHIHGGGFLALSSRSMQTYTRRWAHDVKVPVFSIDYRMPPSYRFPTAPYDCFLVYSFLVKHIGKYFNIIPQQIVIAGDSAGGNLSCALTGLILKHKLPIPKGLFLAYPACDLRKIFSPSRIYSFNDPLLNPPMLMLCLNEYLNYKSESQLNPLASPLLLSEQFVNEKLGDHRFPLNWPRTIIQVGGKDPLLDDSLRLLQRMNSSNIQCSCQIYQNLTHGFLSLNFAISSCTKTIDDSIQFIKKLLTN